MCVSLIKVDEGVVKNIIRILLGVLAEQLFNYNMAWGVTPTVSL